MQWICRMQGKGPPQCVLALGIQSWCVFAVFIVYVNIGWYLIGFQW